MNAILNLIDGALEDNEMSHDAMRWTAECLCGLRTCYECRRREIDEKAEAIYDREIKYCTGMDGFDIEEHAGRMALQYRNQEVNKLAFELAGITD